MRMNAPRRTARHVLVAAGLALPALVLPVTGFAQTSPANTMPATSPQLAPAGAAAAGSITATPPTAPMHKTRRPMKKAASRHVVTPANRVDQRITQLHRELKITAGQQPQWDEFAAVMRANATAANQAYMDRSKKLATMTAVDDMQSYAALSMLHAQDVQKLSIAFQTLYAALTPAQQKTADTVFRGAAAKHHR